MTLRPVLFALIIAVATPAVAGIRLCRDLTIGAELTNISNQLRRDRQIPDFVTGALVRTVRPKSPAAQAGIEPGDVIQGVGDTLIQNVCEFARAATKRGCGTVQLSIRRGVENLVADVLLIDVDMLPRKKAKLQVACRDGDGAACTSLAIENDEDVSLLRLACDLGNGEGCYRLAFKLPDDKEKAAAYEQACDGGNARACTNLGWRYERGLGVRKNTDLAVRLYKRGCDGSACTASNALGCVNLGRSYRDGFGVEEDQFRATALFSEVCERKPEDADDAGTIARACSLTGTSYLSGRGAPKDIQRALTLLEKGCDGGDTFGCYNLGTVYDGGNDVPVDEKRAIAYYQRACNLGDAEACSVSGVKAP